MLIYCVGPPKGKLCGHCGSLMLKDLPDWDWYQISAHLRFTKCGTGLCGYAAELERGYDYNKGVC